MASFRHMAKFENTNRFVLFSAMEVPPHEGKQDAERDILSGLEINKIFACE